MSIKLILTLGILVIGLSFGLIYFLWGAWREADASQTIFGDRPWRRLGAAIAAVTAVMFAVGAYAVDIPDRPGPYAVYWIVLLGMVVWLGVLAVKDVRHTRRIVQQWRDSENERRMKES
ncbi:MAG: hypothetical protein HY287_14445 [Planctomycetes bacterium]|nr:hypothetical protein [Planctomycetota bacterium]MBI3835522.1 hypothetical protein [Planctomycetota bacterium]